MDEFLQNYLNDVAPFMPNAAQEFLRGSPSAFTTVRTSPWRFADKVVLIGDSAHAVVPFYGQGLNAGLEDAVVLDECIVAHSGDCGLAFAAYQEHRKPHLDVLADLSLKNFDMLREEARRPHVLARREAIELLHRLLGQRVISLSHAVQHTTLPYADCQRMAERVHRLARLCGLDLVVGVLALRHVSSGWLRRVRSGRK